MIKAASNVVQQTDSIPITMVNGNTASAGNGNNQSSHQAFFFLKKQKQLNLISADQVIAFFNHCK